VRSAAPRSRFPRPRSPAAAGHWPHEHQPPHPEQQGHRHMAQMITTGRT
jgi:hypothetical protein